LWPLPGPSAALRRHTVRVSYDFPLDRLVQSLKYSHRLALAGFLGHQIAVLAKEVEADLIIPMPLHPKRLRERGFNQALELARPVGRATGLRSTPPVASACATRRRKPLCPGASA